MSYIGSKRSSSLVSFDDGTIGSGVVFPTFVGMIASFAMTTAPTGWLVCNGAEYAIATYGDLYTAIGTTWGTLTNGSGGTGTTHFRVPDLRGAFLRGTGSHGTNNMANGNDFAGLSVGNFEDDQMQTIALSLGNAGTFGTSSYGGNAVRLTGSNAGTTGLSYSASNYTANGQGTPRHGDETRPFNASVQFCIKF